MNKDKEELINILTMPLNKWVDISYDTSDDWVSKILKELCENPEDNLNSSLLIDLKLMRKHDYAYGDHIAIDGEIYLKYFPPCIRCLKPLKERLHVSFKSCFIPQISEKNQLEDADEAYIQGEQRDIYFHIKNKANLTEVIRENIYININKFPLHSTECKGLCFECGIDLNENTCSHHLCKKSLHA